MEVGPIRGCTDGRTSKIAGNIERIRIFAKLLYF